MESELWESDLSPSRSPSMFHWWRLQLRPGEEGEGKAEGRRRRSRVASMVLRIASKVRNIAPPLISRRTAPRLPSSSSFIYFELSNCKFLGGHGGRENGDLARVGACGRRETALRSIFRFIYAILELRGRVPHTYSWNLIQQLLTIYSRACKGYSPTRLCDTPGPIVINRNVT